MLETRLASIARALATARERRALAPLMGGLILGHLLAPAAETPVHAAKKRKRHGKQGRRGPAGPAGPGGVPGPGGATGATGATGEPGTPGAKGDKGDPGAKGDKGDKGDPGPAGSGSCPDGTVFIAAIGCVESAPRDESSFRFAFVTCGSAGQRLLTSAELLAVISTGSSSSIGFTGTEWTGSVLSATEVIVITRGVDPPMSSSPTTNVYPYHCVSVPDIAS